MKYLQIFEAFESNVINKAIKFLKSKKINVDKFKNSLLEFQSVFDYPLSNIEDNDVKYLNYKRAIYLKNEEKVDNKWGIYCIKYWFSLENGYLGDTITGNTRYKYNSDDNNLAFSAGEFNFIKDELDIKTGLLTPVNDYTILKTGDKVIVELIIEEDEDSSITDGVIYRLDNKIYVIQDRCEGLDPQGSEWREYGRYSWIIYNHDTINDDHAHLHLYTKSDDELHYSYETNEEAENYLEYNFPSYNFTPQRWNKTFINDADFAIVIMLDDMLKEKKVKSAISQEKGLRRKGALKLMTDQEVRDFNIDKYLQIQISKLINKDTAEFSNLQKIVCKNYCGKYILPSILSMNASNDSNMNTLANTLLRIAGNVKGDNTSNIKDAINFFKFINKHNETYSEKFKTGLEIAKTIKNDDIKIIIDKIEKISEKIYNYLKKQNIQTIEDLKIILTKINTIGVLFKSNEFNIQQVNTLRYLLSILYLPKEIKENIDYFNNNNSYKKSIESIKIIEKYIDSDFK